MIEEKSRHLHLCMVFLQCECEYGFSEFLLGSYTLYTAQCVLCSVQCPCIFYDPVSDTIRRRGGYSGIFREEGVAVDTGAHFRGNHGSRV